MEVLTWGFLLCDKVRGTWISPTPLLPRCFRKTHDSTGARARKIDTGYCIEKT